MWSHICDRTRTPVNGTELSSKEFQDNLLIWYGIVTLEILTDYNVCGNKILLPHALSCPKVGLVMACHNSAAKELGSLAAQALTSSWISYKPKINSRTVQGERNEAGSRIAI